MVIIIIIIKLWPFPLSTVVTQGYKLALTWHVLFSDFSRSTAFNFNPKPAVPKTLCHSLVELLSQVSPAFRKNFTALQKKR